MELPATLNIAEDRKAALKQAIVDAAKDLSFEDAFYFTLGCRFGLSERADNQCTPDYLLNRNPVAFRNGRDLAFYFH